MISKNIFLLLHAIKPNTIAEKINKTLEISGLIC